MVLELPYHNAFLLTVTPIFNTWRGLGRTLLLLSENSFNSIEGFRCVFPVPPPLQGQIGHNGPEGPLLQLLQLLISRRILARPKSVSGIPSVNNHHEVVKDGLTRMVDLIVLDQTTAGQNLIWGENTLPLSSRAVK